MVEWKQSGGGLQAHLNLHLKISNVRKRPRTDRNRAGFDALVLLNVPGCTAVMTNP
jgi:hypothetical protein